MTERRPPYHALSETTIAIMARDRSLVAPTSPLHQYNLDGSISRDRLLLLPMLDSPAGPDTSPVCMHLVHLPSGHLSLCNGARTHTCPCCSFAMCQAHESTSFIELPDESGTWSEDDTALLCQTCAALTRPQIYVLHAFRVWINQDLHERQD